MRLIDADALKDILCLDDLRQLNLGVSASIIDKLIDSTPTVDAEPVRRGQWVIMRDRTLECSECKSIAPFEADRNGDVVFADEYDYCPHCGAKMDGGETDEDAQS